MDGLEPIWPDAPLLTAEQTAALAEAFVPDVYKNGAQHPRRLRFCI